MTHADNRPRLHPTTPIYYANARPHVGSAYTTLVADSDARFKRMQGYDVAFLTGTDEHGENIARAAAKAGITPRELVDRNSAVFRRLWDELGISYTHFVRTTSIEHLRAVRRLLLRARDSGYIYKAHYEGRYCVFDNLYVSDSIEPIDCPVCGRPAEVVSEENYFFKLSAFQERLLKLYEEQPDFLRPAFRRNEILRFVEAGLRDISVSRKTVKWGLAVAGGSRARRVCVVRRADQLFERDWLRRRRDAVRKVLAGATAPDRQGDYPLPLRVLAGVFVGCRGGVAEGRVRAWLAAV